MLVSGMFMKIRIQKEHLCFLVKKRESPVLKKAKKKGTLIFCNKGCNTCAFSTNICKQSKDINTYMFISLTFQQIKKN